MTSVKVTWDGLLQNSECADWIRVKYWPYNKPNDYDLTEKEFVNKSSIVIDGLESYRKYAFEVGIYSPEIFRSRDLRTPNFCLCVCHKRFKELINTIDSSIELIH